MNARHETRGDFAVGSPGSREAALEAKHTSWSLQVTMRLQIPVPEHPHRAETPPAEPAKKELPPKSVRFHLGKSRNPLIIKLVLPAGIEPTSPASETGALSIVLQERALRAGEE
jgi:hypothetical protein